MAECGGTAESFQLQAFPILEPGEDFDPTIPPRNGDEYLTHMLYERNRCPAIKCAKVIKKSPGSLTSTAVLDDFGPPPNDMSPTLEWKKMQLKRFHDAKNKMQQMRDIMPSHQETDIEFPDNAAPAAEWRRFCYSNMPYTNVILQLSQRTIERLLEHAQSWLTGADEIVAEEDETIEDSTRVRCLELDLDIEHAWLGRWLYGILMCLKWPIEPHVYSTLREIARICLRNRNKLQPQDCHKAGPYNMFICLIAIAFEQSDFEKFL